MPIAAKPRITAWSFSRVSTHATCAAQAKFKFVDRLKESASPAMERGSGIHKMGEDYVNGVLKKLPKELALFKEEFKVAKGWKWGRGTEAEWCLNSAWDPTGWFDRDAWCRIKVDLWLEAQDKKTARVVDLKTGRVNESHLEQLSLYALGAFRMFPDLESVECELWYLDHGKDSKVTYTRAQEAELIKTWDKRSRPLMRDVKFEAKPSSACSWCSFSKSKGGPCDLA